MTETEGATDLLRRLGRDADAVELPIADAALAMAQLARPALDPAPYQAHLAQLADELRAIVGAAPAESTDARASAALRTLFRDRHGYRGDSETYDDLDNADLARVIDRRRGLPVALGILYIETARRQGWAAHGLSFPGHFLVGIAGAGERAILDPFSGGAVCDARRLKELLKAMDPAAELEPEHYASVADREVLLRLQNNIKSRLLRAGDSEAASAVLDRMLLLAPRRSQLWREAGLLAAHLDRITAAIAAFKTALELTLDPIEARETEALLQNLRRRLQ